MILPWRDKINEHLLHDGSDVNIYTPEEDAFWWKLNHGIQLNWEFLFTRYPKDYISLEVYRLIWKEKLMMCCCGARSKIYFYVCLKLTCEENCGNTRLPSSTSTKCTSSNYLHFTVWCFIFAATSFLWATSNYLKRKTRAVSEFRLKQLKWNFFCSVPFHTIHLAVISKGVVVLIGCRVVGGMGVINGRGCSCYTGQATKLFKKVVR